MARASHAALLMLAYGVEVTASIGLGVVLLAINSIYLTFVHQFYLGGSLGLCRVYGFGRRVRSEACPLAKPSYQSNDA